MGKIFLLLVGLVAKEAFGQKAQSKITVDTRAPSTYENCNCQCNSDTWTDGTTVKGNCRSQDRNGALFCYVSGTALCSCRDVQQSSFLPNNDGRLKYYSYEACTTPPRNQCSNYGQQNFGDGDFKYCQNGGGFGGSSSYRPSRPGSSSSYRPNRPGGSSSYRPGGSSSYRPGGSSSFGGSRNPPRGNQNSGRPSLGDILSGVRNSGNSGSSDSASSSGSISFDAFTCHSFLDQTC